MGLLHQLLNKYAGPTSQTLMRLSACSSLILAAACSLSMAQKPGHVIDPQTASGNVWRAIHDIPWQTTLSESERLAQKSGKMVLWVQMKGCLDGYT